MVKTKEELLQEEEAIDLETPVQMPPQVRQIFERGLSSISRGPSECEQDLSALTTEKNVSELLWWMYQNPDNQIVAYLRKAESLPTALKEYEESGYVTITYHAHYYRRTRNVGDWYRLPGEYWSREGDELDEAWPAAIRKIVRNSDSYWKLELHLTQKAVRAADRFLSQHELRQATYKIRDTLRQPIVEAKPGVFGFSINLLSLREWWERRRRR